LKIRHGAIVDNVVTYVYAKSGNDRLRNEKALADRKSDNNNPMRRPPPLLLRPLSLPPAAAVAATAAAVCRQGGNL